MAAIGHDLNNLLTAIHLSTQVALGRTGSDEAVRPCLDEILAASALAVGLARQLRQLRPDAEPVPEGPVDGVVQGFAGVLRRVLGSDVELALDLNCPLRPRIPSAHLQQILLNLADNARDAMPSGGTLRIETRCPRCEGTDRPRCVAIIVSDTGCGIDAETLERVFEPFYSTKPNGTGIGLATVSRLVREAGGRVDVQSTPRTGTSFRIVLPEGV